MSRMLTAILSILIPLALCRALYGGSMHPTRSNVTPPGSRA
ncbi:hypothetical protein [Deinococcus sp. UR1]|nr:hypothetical protein [Deinococcus sp. UR1]